MARNSFSIKVDGDKALGIKFGKMDIGVAHRVKGITRKRTFAIERGAKQIVPVDTGHLRRSIRSTFLSDGLTGVVGTNVRYAIYVEDGTRYMPARPYMYPNYIINRAKYLREIRQVLRDVTK